MRRPFNASSSFSPMLFSVLTAILILAFAGCESERTGVAGPESGGPSLLATAGGAGAGPKEYYPLSIGNRWEFSGWMMIMTAGSLAADEMNYTEVREMVGTEERFGREYILEERVRDDGSMMMTEWLRYRQDHSGLYEADISITEPPIGTAAEDGELSKPAGDKRNRRWDRLAVRFAGNGGEKHDGAFAEAAARLVEKMRMLETISRIGGPIPVLGSRPGGVLPDELTRLHYPLHPKQEWVIREIPLFTAEVLENDVLDLPAGRMKGHLVSISGSLFGPEDRAYFWYGKNGMLKMDLHVEETVVDIYGNPIGILIAKEKMTLEELDLAD